MYCTNASTALRPCIGIAFMIATWTRFPVTLLKFCVSMYLADQKYGNIHLVGKSGVLQALETNSSVD